MTVCDDLHTLYQNIALKIFDAVKKQKQSYQTEIILLNCINPASTCGAFINL